MYSVVINHLKEAYKGNDYDEASRVYMEEIDKVGHDCIMLLRHTKDGRTTYAMREDHPFKKRCATGDIGYEDAQKRAINNASDT